jgi:crotonobetainyl-CoA:carnitine CoA-transferase CaiB-like acyl-CoA transferase
MTDLSPLPCAGLRVLDFGQGYGAIPGMILADYGADVVKVEPPEGELWRDAPAFLQWNRGKRGIVLDLRDAGDRARAVELAQVSDVLIQGFRPAATMPS